MVQCGQSAGNLKSWGILRDYTPDILTVKKEDVDHAYLQGALADATYSHRQQTFRFGQSDMRWLELLKQLLQRSGVRSWIYREGKNRKLYVLETTAKFLDLEYDLGQLGSHEEIAAYIRGFFDAEGGLPKIDSRRFYIQLAQKNLKRIKKIKFFLEKMNIKCGVVHNPSFQVDPHYWRFYVKCQSWKDFARKIGSWHPRKAEIFLRRMVI
jgi:hypothetical protein